jgi:hypothetical protein
MTKSKSCITPPLLWLLCLVTALLPACSEQTGQVNALKDQISNASAGNLAAATEVSNLVQQLSLVNRQNSASANSRAQFEAQAKKSAQTERLLTTHRKEIEASGKQYQEDIAAYRQQYLQP